VLLIATIVVNGERYTKVGHRETSSATSVRRVEMTAAAQLWQQQQQRAGGMDEMK